MGRKKSFVVARRWTEEAGADLDAKVRKNIESKTFPWWKRLWGFFNRGYLAGERKKAEILHESVMKSIKKRLTKKMVYGE
jgi:hypothetical protein